MAKERPDSPMTGKPMVEKELNGVKIDLCPETGGMFLHRGQLNQLLNIPEDEGDIERSSIDHKRHEDTHGDIICPFCDHGKMTKINFLQHSQIILDHCDNCGSLWIDGDELKKINNYWHEVEEGSVNSHDPLSMQILNFLKSASLTFFSLVILLMPLKLQAQDAYSQLKSKIGGMYSSMTGNFSFTSSNGMVTNGKIYYKYPNKLHLRTSDGGVIATNGNYLWLYNPSSMICARQDVGGGSGGILGMIRSYNGTVRGNTYIFRKESGGYDEIIVRVGSKTIRSVQLKKGDVTYTYSFSGVRVGSGIKASLFSYKPPPNARVIENPLNR